MEYAKHETQAGSRKNPNSEVRPILLVTRVSRQNIVGAFLTFFRSRKVIGGLSLAALLSGFWVLAQVYATVLAVVPEPKHLRVDSPILMEVKDPVLRGIVEQHRAEVDLLKKSVTDLQRKNTALEQGNELNNALANAELEFFLGLSAFDEMNYSVSAMLLESSLQKRQTSSTYKALGWTYYRQYRNKDALRAFEKAKKLRRKSGLITGDPDLAMGLGAVYTQAKQYSKAENQFKLALTQHKEQNQPPSWALLINLAILRTHTLALDEALDLYNQASEVASNQSIPDDGTCEWGKSTVLSFLWRHEEALAMIEEAKSKQLKLSGQFHPKLNYDRACVLYKMDRREEAKECAIRAVDELQLRGLPVSPELIADVEDRLTKSL